MLGVPRKLLDFKNQSWTFSKKDPNGKLVYSQENGCSGHFRPYEVEKNFKRDGRPVPKSSIIQQGKYECLPTAIAMMLGESLFSIKRAMAKFEWRNDDKGATDEMAFKACQLLGYDLLSLEPEDLTEDLGPCILNLRSLNVPRMNHAVTWKNQEILDPNWNRPGRLFWGTEWCPVTIGAAGGDLLLPFSLSSSERALMLSFYKNRPSPEAKALKADILLNRLK